MEKESFFFAFLRRMRFIRRWGLMRNTESENIQEHSLDVAFIAHNLAYLHNLNCPEQPIDANKTAVMAMYHEVSEIFTGDMPTPIKYFDPMLRKLYGEVESLAQEKMLETLPQELQESYKPFLTEAEISEEWVYVKAADTIAAYFKCVDEVNAGNSEFKEAKASIFAKLENSNLSEVKQFLSLYEKSLGYSLDKLDYGVK